MKNLAVSTKVLVIQSAVMMIFGLMKDTTPLYGFLIQGTRPTFEVAYIKPTDPSVRSGGTLPGCHGSDSRFPAGLPIVPPPLGRCQFRGYSLKALINKSFGTGLPLYQVSDTIVGPDWIDKERFDVEAKAESPETTTEYQLNLMLQNLLVDRFRLKLRQEAREVPGFALVLSKGGPKFGKAGEQSEGVIIGNKFLSMTMSHFADYLRSKVGRPVVDMTGLTGSYTFTMSPTSAEPDPGVLAAFPPEIAERIRSSATPESSIFTVLQSDLGLRLESRKVPVPVTVVISAERPIP